MPNIKISALPDNPTPAASANTVVQEGVANSKVTLANLVKAAVDGGTAASVGLATVAKTGAYSDLLNPPTIGTIASQDKTSVTITGGSITGIADLAIADGGTGASTVGGAVTALGLDYASKNTVSTIVQRDGSGNFVAGTITASLTGNATTATSATTATNLAAGVAGAISYQSGAGTTAFTAAGVSQQVLISDGTSSPTWTDQSNLTVSAKGLIGNQTANFIYAGPTTAPAAVASFRAMVATDVPTLNQNTTGTAAGLSTTLVATSGGTGQSSYAVGDILYASTTTALTKLTAGAVNTVLHATGPSSPPVYGKVVLTTEVSGALPLLNGGTGTAAATAAAALNALLPSQTGNPAKALITDGTNATWSALGAGTITNVTCTNSVGGLTLTPISPGTSSGAVTIALSGTVGTGNGGTGATSPAVALTNLGAQPVKANLTSFGNVTGAADRVPYFTAASTIAVAPLTQAGRDFLVLSTQAAQANYINQNVVTPIVSVAIDPCGRLTTSASLAVNASDAASVVTLYYLPYKGNIVQLHDGTTWVSRTLPTSAITISLSGLLAATGYDVFINWNGSAVVASTVVWSTGTTVANNSDSGLTASLSNPIRFAVTRTALTTLNGRLVQTADNTKLYVGSFHTTNTAGQTADTLTQRLVANQYHRILKRLRGAQSFGNAVVPNVSQGEFITPGSEGTSPPNTNGIYVNYQSKFGCTMPPLNGSVWIMGATNTEYAVQTNCFVQYQAIPAQYALSHLALYTATHLSAGRFVYASSLPQVLDFQAGAWAAGAGGAYQIQANCNLITPLHSNMVSAGLIGFQPVISGYGNTVQYMWHGPIVTGYVYC